MGFTHFDKVCGVNGVYVGAKGSETGVFAGTSVLVNVTEASTAANTQYIVAPIAGAVTGYAALSVSAGTGRVVSVALGSAGDNLCATAVTGVTGTIGASVVMSASSGGNTCTAGQALRVVLASCATAQVQVGVTVVFTPTV
jgi:hypothetical protein